MRLCNIILDRHLETYVLYYTCVIGWNTTNCNSFEHNRYTCIVCNMRTNTHIIYITSKLVQHDTLYETFLIGCNTLIVLRATEIHTLYYYYNNAPGFRIRQYNKVGATISNISGC